MSLDPNAMLSTLISGWENECVEFKEASHDYKTSEIGKYFSALSNEANLKGRASAWLVFGVRNSNRTVVGTSYREDRERLMSLKHQVTGGIEPSMSFTEIHEFQHDGHRVILFQIPPAPQGIPISWNGHHWAREHESLVALSEPKRQQILSQSPQADWSAEIIVEASIGDLDAAAIAKAREVFSQKFSSRIDATEIGGWDDSTFLDKAKLTRSGQITRTAILLLGKSESSHFISPHVAEMSWKLVGEETAYEHFSPPFLLTTSDLYRCIRNIKLTLLPAGELIPREVTKYDQRIILEALHNCIAHQDYTMCERILVTERPTELEFRNAGAFYDGTPEDYLLSSRSPARYRNRLLAEAMVNLRMIDTMGFGIREVMFRGQARRFFPLPDFDLSDPSHVVLRIVGRFIDENYSRILLEKHDIEWPDVLALDKVQKGIVPEDAAVARLRKLKLIEGRKPNLHVAADLLNSPEARAEYIRHRALDDDFYSQLIIEFLEKFRDARRADIDRLLIEKLSDSLSPAQKEQKVKNLLQNLRKRGIITPHGKTRNAVWRLVSAADSDNRRQS